MRAASCRPLSIKEHLCAGIVGCHRQASATPILVEGLTRMEYRGYDSAGVAVEQDGGIQVITRKGKVAELAHTLGHFEMTGTCGIGHTRWATHGKPSEANAHPHTSCSGDIAVVHNGIIENFAELREELVGRGHVFKSETDTEVVAHLVEESYHRMPFSAPATCAAVSGAAAFGLNFHVGRQRRRRAGHDHRRRKICP